MTVSPLSDRTLFLIARSISGRWNRRTYEDLLLESLACTALTSCAAKRDTPGLTKTTSSLRRYVIKVGMFFPSLPH